MVLHAAREVGIPCHHHRRGYGRDVDTTVEVHCRTVRVAAAMT